MEVHHTRTVNHIVKFSGKPNYFSRSLKKGKEVNYNYYGGLPSCYIVTKSIFSIPNIIIFAD